MVGNQPFLLQGDTNDLDRFAGGKATVNGLMSGDNIRVGSVSKPGAMPQPFGAQEQSATNALR